MSATQEITIKKLGIIAGGGTLPEYLVTLCKDKGIEPFIVGFKGQTPEHIMTGHTHLLTGLGCAGKIIKFLKSNNVHDLVMIGNIKRPALTELKPDLKALQILSRIGFKALGDNGLLTALKKELEHEGFTLHGIQRFCDRLLIKEGVLGRYAPIENDKISIELGIKISQTIGALDIGQSVIVQNGVILGIEAAEGTDALIKRCADLQKQGRGGILVKTCKPQQDRDLDLPTIGIETIINAHKSGLSGIIVQANQTLIIDPKTIAEYADRYKLFVVGIMLNKINS